MADVPMDRSISATHVATRKPAPQACRWGDSTLDQRFPEWVNAWESPWTCRHPAHSGPLDSIETCITCSDWRPRERPDDRRGA